MNADALADLEFSFLEDGFSARDIVEQKINESSMTVSISAVVFHQQRDVFVGRRVSAE